MSKDETRPDRKRRSATRTPHDGEGGAGHRHERLSRLLREELEALVRDELGDPGLAGVAITSVELSVDYKNARAGFIAPGAATTDQGQRDRLIRALARATPFLRARLAESVELKAVPALRFTWDAYAAQAPEAPEAFGAGAPDRHDQD